MLLRKLRVALALLSIMLFLPFSFAQKLIIASSTQYQKDLSKENVKQIFMLGQKNPFGLIPINQSVGNKARTIFNSTIVGLTESRLQSYWSQMRFSGRNHQPFDIGNNNDVIQFLLEKQGYIGYFLVDDNEGIPNNIFVVFSIDIN